MTSSSVLLVQAPYGARYRFSHALGVETLGYIRGPSGTGLRYRWAGLGGNAEILEFIW